MAGERSRTAKCALAVVEGYLSGQFVRPDEIADLVTSVQRTFEALSSGGQLPIKRSPPMPRSQVRASIMRDFLISFENGMYYRGLTAHLAARGLTPDQYRKKWGLPADYPMIAPSYEVARKELARRTGLGVRVRPPTTKKNKP